MPEERTAVPEETQQTEHGETIPVPTRRDVFGDLRKVAKAEQPSDTEDGGGAGEQ